MCCVKAMIIEGVPLTMHDLVPDLNGITGQSNDAFDEIFVFIFRKPEDDDIAALDRRRMEHGSRGVTGDRRKSWLDLTVGRPLQAVGQLAHQNVVAHQQGWESWTRKEF